MRCIPFFSLRLRSKARSLLVLLTLSLCSKLSAGPVSGLVFDEVSLKQTGELNVIRIGFQQPVQFGWFYPQKPANEVLIQVRAFRMGTDELSAWKRNENALLPPEARPFVEEIEFEPSEFMDAFIRVRFLHETSFQVQQGRDWRSIEIRIPQDTPVEKLHPQERPTRVESEVMEH